MTLTTVRAGAYIHHIMLLSENPERLASFYGDAMNMEIERLSGDDWLCSGPKRHLLVGKGPNKTLGLAGLGCRDRDGLGEIHERAQREGLKVETSPSPLFEAGAFGVRDPDNNLIVFGMGRYTLNMWGKAIMRVGKSSA